MNEHVWPVILAGTDCEGWVKMGNGRVRKHLRRLGEKKMANLTCPSEKQLFQHYASQSRRSRRSLVGFPAPGSAWKIMVKKCFKKIHNMSKIIFQSLLSISFLKILFCLWHWKLKVQRHRKHGWRNFNIHFFWLWFLFKSPLVSTKSTVIYLF